LVLQISPAQQKKTRKKALQRIVCVSRIVRVPEALISACSADLKHALAGHSMSAKTRRKSMKTQLSRDFFD